MGFFIVIWTFFIVMWAFFSFRYPESAAIKFVVQYAFREDTSADGTSTDVAATAGSNLVS